MNVKEKLIEILEEPCGGLYPAYELADYLLDNGVTVQECKLGVKKTNADYIRSMSDEELAKFLTHMNPANCQDCAFSHGWRCQPDRDDYSDFEKCKEGRKRWLKQPAKGE